MHRKIRRSELLAECASTHTRDDPPTLPAADNQKIRLRSKRNDCVLDAEHTPTARFISYHRSSFSFHSTQEIMLPVEAVAVWAVLVVVALDAFPSIFPPNRSS